MPRPKKVNGPLEDEEMDKALEKEEEEEEEEEKEEEEVDPEFEKVNIPAEVISCAMKAKHSPSGYDSDVNGNEAQVNHDGTVRISMKLPDNRGHSRYDVRLPDEFAIDVRKE